MSKLKEHKFKNHTVNIIRIDEDEIETKEECLLWAVLEGSGFYPEIQNNIYGMVDDYNDDEFTELGTNLDEALIALSNYTEYFQGEEENCTWYTEFI